MDSNKFQIAYFPYLFLNRFHSIALLGVKVWNSTGLLNRITDETLRHKVATLVAQNRILGKPIKDIGIVDIGGGHDFRPLTPSEDKKMNEIRIVLFLAGMAECNTREGPNAGHHMLTSDNFKIVYQNFKLDSPYTGYASGRIVRASDFGYKIAKITYEKPPYVLKNSFSCEEKFLNKLEQLRHKKRKTYRLILRASNSVMNAYTNSEDVSSESRILEFSRAFEILFELPEKEPRKKFKEAIEKYCEPLGERKKRYLSERPNQKKKPETKSRHVMWADRFYTLRNHIIHGGNITDKRFLFYDQPHYQLALWFFLVAVKQIVNEVLGSKIFYDSVKCQSGTFVYDNGFWGEGKAKMLQTLIAKNP
ncbi:MAG TPA: hypothetical protein VMW42_01780 [Desulfatiglandales bacterium]|nr:hypothetical protein [Desulfatiglandales bacterium]